MGVGGRVGIKGTHLGGVLPGEACLTLISRSEP